MERLTRRTPDGGTVWKPLDPDCRSCGACNRRGYHMSLLVHRLAAYEDTGLEPEEIASQVFLIAAQKDPEKLAHLRDIVLADEAGRLVVLPCKMGDTIYQLRGAKHARGVGISPRIVSCVEVRGQDYAVLHQGTEPCLKKDFNKTWFLNRPEAEEALEKEKEHGTTQI